MKKIIILIACLITIIFARPENEKYINGEWYQCKTYFYDNRGNVEKVIDVDSSIMIYKNFYYNETLIKSIGNQANHYYHTYVKELKFNSCGDTVSIKHKWPDTEIIETFNYKYIDNCKIKQITSSNWSKRIRNGKEEYNNYDIIKKYTYTKNKTIIKKYIKNNYDEPTKYDGKEEYIYDSGELLKLISYFSSGNIWYSTDYKTNIHITGDAIFEEIDDIHYNYKDHCTRRIE